MTDESPLATAPDVTGTPRWVKVFAILIALLVLLIIVVLLVPGGHGPGIHTP